jgi:hypothetical protein
VSRFQVGDIAIEDPFFDVHRSYEIVQLRQGYIKLKGLFECKGYRWVSIPYFFAMMISVCRPNENVNGGLVEVWFKEEAPNDSD